MNSPPRLSIYSLTTVLESNALTTAPMLLARPRAASPAIPHPIINTFDGLIFPAAVIYDFENLGS